jgi:hypothetical protein
MKSENFFIAYPLQLFSANGTVTTPFKITVRTDDLALEKKCAAEFPDLMFMAQYNQDQLFRLQKMKRLIQSSLSQSYINQVHELFYTGKYLYPIPFDKKISNIKITGYDCKMWTNSEPRLELEGTITISIPDVWRFYYESGIIKVQHNKKLVRNEILMFFSKPLPLLLVYDRATELKNRMLELIKKDLKDKGSKISKDFSTLTKNPRLNELTKEVAWMSLDVIKVAMNDLSENILNKMKNNKGKIAFGYLLYQALKTKK